MKQADPEVECLTVLQHCLNVNDILKDLRQLPYDLKLSCFLLVDKVMDSALIPGACQKHSQAKAMLNFRWRIMKTKGY